MLRKYPRLMLVTLVLLFVLPFVMLPGCGGGGGGGNGGDGEGAVIDPKTKVIPADGSVEITEETPESIGLKGAVPNLQAGDIIVSGIGRGFLRKVESVQTTGVAAQQGGSIVEVQTSQGTLEELFKSVNIDFVKSLGPSDFTSMQPLVAGVSFGTWPSGVAPSDPLEIPVNFDKVVLAGPANDPILYVDGTARLRLDCDLKIVIDNWQLQHFKFAPHVSVAFRGEVVARGHASVHGQAWIGHWPGAPFTILVPVPPPVFALPLVFTPELDVFVKFDGTLEAGIELTPTLQLSVTCGVEYTPSSDWKPFITWQHDLDLGSPPNVYTTANARVGLFCPRLSLYLYGVAGPYVEADMPYAVVEYTIEPSPLQQVIDGWIGVDASVGALVRVLGQTLIDYQSPPLQLPKVHLVHLTFPLGGEVPIIID